MAGRPNVSASAPTVNSKKRKDPPQTSSKSQQSLGKGNNSKRVKIWDARTILTQPADAALKNGELDLQSFLRSREFEIKALQGGMEKSKSSRSLRAFQQVPRDLRRRTASHNAKRVPKRLQKRAKREMKEDNTPVVSANKRKTGSSRGRLRAETAKRLGLLAKKKRAEKGQGGDIETRAARPKIRKNKLNDPPQAKSKFRKRQINKTWLPTHMWLAKRARMTEPKNPLWRFAIPLTSTEKSYRPTHRAGGMKGAVAWDMSYMSTIGLEGPAASLEKVLKGIGVNEQGLWEKKGQKWREGKRSWSGWLSREVENQRLQVAPSTIIWCPAAQLTAGEESEGKPTKAPRLRLFIRVHPSAFLETWNEVLRLSKLQRPSVQVEDLRFEIGSIDISGPGSTETLLGILHPYLKDSDQMEEHGQTFRSLAGVTNPASLPPNSLLSFSVMDPRLRYPPRPVQLPDASNEESNFKLLEMLSSWPIDNSTGSAALFDREQRFKASRLPSQKALNRRKSLALPGSYMPMTETDAPIPIVLLTSRTLPSPSSQGTWTVLVPWKCILPMWYGLVHYPLSSGGNPRFGGLEELRQTYFEHEVPWFPADYPGTAAGSTWEADQRMARKDDWDKRPKGKRTEWDSLNLGAGRKGEVGRGWTCDFEQLFGIPSTEQALPDLSTESTGSALTANMPSRVIHNPLSLLGSKAFRALISSSEKTLPTGLEVSTIRLTLVSRGVATPCARIYRLPAAEPQGQRSDTDRKTIAAREEWLSLLPQTLHSKPLPNPKAKDLRNRGRIPLNVPLPQRVRLLAESLVQSPPLPYPADNEDDEHLLVPGEEDLIGFVTTGAYNLAEGKGVAIGTVSVAKVLEGMKRGSIKEGKLCIVRNSGERIGRLARWEAV